MEGAYNVVLPQAASHASIQAIGNVCLTRNSIRFAVEVSTLPPASEHNLEPEASITYVTNL